MPYRSNAARVKAGIVQGTRAGLTAYAQFYTQRVQARLDRGYTTGAFSHHARGVAGRVMYTEPYETAGGWAITVGTSKIAGFPYELGWELGHLNIFVGQSAGPAVSSVGSRRQGAYMRVEIWRPEMEATADRAVEMLRRNIVRYVGL